MKCHKCGNEMTEGAIGPSAKGSIFWAENEYFNSKIGNLFTERNAIKNGGISIPIRDGILNERTKAWACLECKFVLIDCNK